MYTSALNWINNLGWISRFLGSSNIKLKGSNSTPIKILIDLKFTLLKNTWIASYPSEWKIKRISDKQAKGKNKIKGNREVISNHTIAFWKNIKVVCCSITLLRSNLVRNLLMKLIFFCDNTFFLSYFLEGVHRQACSEN